MNPAIRARALCKEYPKAEGSPPALDRVDLDIPAGQIYGIIGRNGAGKTTFVRICATQLAATSGSLEVLGYDALGRPGDVRPHIACVPQESRPLYFVTVWQLIDQYLRMRGMDRAESHRRTTAVLEELDLTKVAHRLVSVLSGGMRRRAMVAMVLASDAEVLYLDEPTTGLDPLARREVWAAIQRARASHRTVVLTTHYLDEAEALSDRLALLEGGKVMLEGRPSDLKARVAQPYRVTVEGAFGAEELRSYGTVSPIEGGNLVFATEPAARELALAALTRGARISMGPVSLEDLFLQTVGKRLDEDDPLESAAEAP